MVELSSNASEDAVTDRSSAPITPKTWPQKAKSVAYGAALFGLAWLALLPGENTPTTSSEGRTGLSAVERGIDLYDAEKYEEARAVFTSAIAADGSNPQAFYERGMTYLGLKQPELALADFRRALELDPTFPGARDWLAKTLNDQGQYLAAAVEWLREARAESLDKDGMGVGPSTWADCAEAYDKGGAPEEAHRVLDEYFTQHADKITYHRSDETDPLRLKASLLLKRQEPTLALEYAERAARSKHVVPADVVVHALALEANGKLDEALRAAKRADKMNGPFPETVALRARIRASKAKRAPTAQSSSSSSVPP